MRTPCSSESPPVVVECVHFRAGPHLLEGELSYPEADFPSGAVVLAGPHPLLGGTMHNNVVRALADGLAGQKMATLKFNYRGVGRSEGPPPDLERNLIEFWEKSAIRDERDIEEDLRGARDFLKSAVGDWVPLALVGYSFGCSLLPGASARDQVPLVLIAPAVGRHPLSFAGLGQAKLVIAPKGDFACEPARLEEWFADLPGPKTLLRPSWDGHFFRRHEEELVEGVATFLEDTWR